MYRVIGACKLLSFFHTYFGFEHLCKPLSLH